MTAQTATTPATSGAHPQSATAPLQLDDGRNREPTASIASGAQTRSRHAPEVRLDFDSAGPISLPSPDKARGYGCIAELMPQTCDKGSWTFFDADNVLCCENVFGWLGSVVSARCERTNSFTPITSAGEGRWRGEAASEQLRISGRRRGSSFSSVACCFSPDKRSSRRRSCKGRRERSRRFLPDLRGSTCIRSR